MKHTNKVPTQADLYDSALDIPSNIKEELNKKGLTARWINATEFRKSFGFHKSKWVPYKRELPKGASTSPDSLYGGDPEGYVRRGDLVLAVKTKEENARHAGMLKQRADLYSGKQNQAAAELREQAKRAGVKTKVDDSFGEDEDEE